MLKTGGQGRASNMEQGHRNPHCGLAGGRRDHKTAPMPRPSPEACRSFEHRALIWWASRGTGSGFPHQSSTELDHWKSSNTDPWSKPFPGARRRPESVGVGADRHPSDHGVAGGVDHRDIVGVDVLLGTHFMVESAPRLCPIRTPSKSDRLQPSQTHKKVPDKILLRISAMSNGGCFCRTALS